MELPRNARRRVNLPATPDLYRSVRRPRCRKIFHTCRKDTKNPRVRLKAELDQAHQEIALLKEQLRIINARMEVIPPSNRPNYPPTERLAILEFKATRGWTLDKTAKAFLVTPATIASWMKRLDEDGPSALVQLPTPVNKFPDLVRYLVKRLKTLCPTLGKQKSLKRLPGQVCISERLPSAKCLNKSQAMNHLCQLPSLRTKHVSLPLNTLIMCGTWI